MRTKLEELFPKDNLYLLYVYAISMSVSFFGLSWKDVLAVLVIDSCSFLVLFPIDKFLFLKIFPQFGIIYKFDDVAKEVADSPVKQQELFERLASYPEKRCLYLLIFSLLKVFPVGFYIATYSNISSGFMERLALFYLMDFFILIYGHGLLFIQLHIIASEKMGALMNVAGWKENYQDLRLTMSNDRMTSIQNIILVSLLTSILFVAMCVGSSTSLFLLYLTACLCIAKIQILFQQFFKGSLEEIFKSFASHQPNVKLPVLPVHTSPVLAGFEYTFNQLSSKLDSRESEISQWIRHESQQFHLRSLGEVTALVAHDIKTPLHVMQLSLEMINDPQTSKEDVAKYHSILEKNLNQTISFTDTLMAYLRGSKGTAVCSYKEIHNHLIDLMRTQFLRRNFYKIQFCVSDNLQDLQLNVNRLDAMHVFYNLYQNAVKTVLESGIENPTITIWSEQVIGDQFVSIFIKDNGQGLAEDKFRKLITFDRYRSDEYFYQGLGLRITNTIINYLHGKLDIMPANEGTCLRLQFPVNSKNIEDTSNEASLSLS